MDFKKQILLIFCTIGLSSCDWLWPFGEDLDKQPSSYTEWHLKNTTVKTIGLYFYYGEFYDSIAIPQKNDTLLDCIGSDANDTFYKLWSGARDSVAVKLSGNIVRVWRKSEKSNSGKQFFNQSSWKESTGTREGKPCTIWTFEILPEDIGSK